jgi:transcriptional regulator with XRE-family HTH domain
MPDTTEVLPVRIALRLIRLKRQCSQRRLAELLGVTRSTVTRYESGKRAIDSDNVLPMSVALGVEPGLFFRLTTDSPELQQLVPLDTPAPANDHPHTSQKTRRTTPATIIPMQGARHA